MGHMNVFRPRTFLWTMEPVETYAEPTGSDVFKPLKFHPLETAQSQISELLSKRLPLAPSRAPVQQAGSGLRPHPCCPKRLSKMLVSQNWDALLRVGIGVPQFRETTT